MGTKAYHLTTDFPESPHNYPIDTVQDAVHEYIIPNTGYRGLDPIEDDAVKLESTPGEAYLSHAFEKTQNTIEDAVSTISEAVTTKEDNWEKILADRDVRIAAQNLGQVRGEATHLYGLQYSLGIHTPLELSQHLDQYGPEPEGERHIVIVPITLTY